MFRYSELPKDEKLARERKKCSKEAQLPTAALEGTPDKLLMENK